MESGCQGTVVFGFASRGVILYRTDYRTDDETVGLTYQVLFFEYSFVFSKEIPFSLKFAGKGYLVLFLIFGVRVALK